LDLIWIYHFNLDPHNLLTVKTINIKKNYMKLLLKFLILSFFLSSIISCNTDDLTSSNPKVTFKATLNGANDGSTNASKATGTVILTFDTTTKIFLLTGNSTGITAVYGHIHKGGIGAGEPPVFILSDLNTSITYKSVPLNVAQETDLNANLYYITLHSAAFPDDEISGLLIKQVTELGTPPSPPSPPSPPGY
jgi:hypothetical protein